MLDLQAIARTQVATEPFPFMAAMNVMDSTSLASVAQDFPKIMQPGVFPLSSLTYGDAFSKLLEVVRSRELEAIMEEKFDIDLSDKPLMITVRGYCQKKDGRIHTDSKDKLVTCLLYLNDPNWNEAGGRLRLLHSGDSIDNPITEIPPNGGSFVAFKRTDNSWHGHAPFEGQRRYIMFNWVRSDVALAKNMGRHKLSSAFKRFGLFDGY